MLQLSRAKPGNPASYVYYKVANYKRGDSNTLRLILWDHAGCTGLFGLWIDLCVCVCVCVRACVRVCDCDLVNCRTLEAVRPS